MSVCVAVVFCSRDDIVVVVWRSHDGFHTDENGVFMPVTAKYADQSRVFKDLGQGVLDNAFQGNLSRENEDIDKRSNKR